MNATTDNANLFSKFHAIVLIGSGDEFVTEYDLVDVATSALIMGDEIRRASFYRALPTQGIKLITRALSVINTTIRAGHTNGAWTGAADLRAFKTAQWGFEQALITAGTC